MTPPKITKDDAQYICSVVASEIVHRELSIEFPQPDAWPAFFRAVADALEEK